MISSSRDFFILGGSQTGDGLFFTGVIQKGPGWAKYTENSSQEMEERAGLHVCNMSEDCSLERVANLLSTLVRPQGRQGVLT